MSMSKVWTVYLMTFPNGKKYVGITSDVKRRIRSHRHCEHQAYPGPRPLTHAIRKYGWDSVVFETLHEGLTAEDAYAEETRLIAQLNTQDFMVGYNLASGGRTNKGYRHPNPWNKGRRLSPEHCAKLSAAKLSDPGLRARASDASSRYPVVARDMDSGKEQYFKNVNVCAVALGVGKAAARNHVARGGVLLANRWQVRRINQEGV